MLYKVFISHAGTDTWIAKQIERNITDIGAGTFLDASDIEIGDKFEDKIAEEIERSDEMVVLFTPWSIERPYVWLEIGAAWYKKMRIIIVLLGLTGEEIAKNPKMPVSIKSRDIITINELDEYFTQLKNRVISHKQ